MAEDPIEKFLRYIRYAFYVADVVVGLSIFYLAMTGDFFSPIVLIIVYGAVRIFLGMKLVIKDEPKTLNFKRPDLKPGQQGRQPSAPGGITPSEQKEKTIWDSFFPEKERQAEALERKVQGQKSMSDEFYNRQIGQFKDRS